MRIGVFTMTVVALLLLLASLNSYWLGRLLRPERRRGFRLAYALLTVASAAAYLGIRVAGQFDDGEGADRAAGLVVQGGVELALGGDGRRPARRRG